MGVVYQFFFSTTNCFYFVVWIHYLSDVISSLGFFNNMVKYFCNDSLTDGCCYPCCRCSVPFCMFTWNPSSVSYPLFSDFTCFCILSRKPISNFWINVSWKELKFSLRMVIPLFICVCLNLNKRKSLSAFSSTNKIIWASWSDTPFTINLIFTIIPLPLDVYKNIINCCAWVILDSCWKSCRFLIDKLCVACGYFLRHNPHWNLH